MDVEEKKGIPSHLSPNQHAHPPISQPSPSDPERPENLLAARILGEHSLIRTLRKTILRYASASLPVLLMGERGTGKELAARALHDFSNRHKMEFMIINCPSMPETLLESELFGHVRGAFTGAKECRSGRFLEADGGTAFLDEIGDIPESTQMKLLRVTENGEFSPLGTNRVTVVDVRLVAATNRDLGKLTRDGVFREDLYDRLQGIIIHMPPLRSHLEDLPLYVAHFLKRQHERRKNGPREATEGAIELLLRSSWPGNVRHLRQVVLRAAEGTEEDTLSAEAVREALEGPLPPEVRPCEKIRPRIPSKEELLRIIEENHWVMVKVGKHLGVARSTLYEWMDRLGIQR